jgi:hypothetical protein
MPQVTVALSMLFESYCGIWQSLFRIHKQREISVLATEPMGHSVSGSNPTEDGGFLWVIKIRSAHFLRRGSKAVGPMS